MTLFDDPDLGRPDAPRFGREHIERPRPVVRRGDPPTAHHAARRVEPMRGTRKATVLAYLRARPGVWIDGHEFLAANVGGTEGLRRLRELRQDGWQIEMRPTGRTAWQYRLNPEDL